MLYAKNMCTGFNSLFKNEQFLYFYALANFVVWLFNDVNSNFLAN